jgi:hypothetical protein
MDQVETLVETAATHLARRGLTAQLYAGAIETAEIAGSYDVAIFSSGCYSYLCGSPARAAALSRVRASLRKGGRVLFSYHPDAKQSSVNRWLTRITARLSGADWIPEPGDVFCRHHRGALGVLSYRHTFDPERLQRECAAAGFRILDEESFDEILRFAAIAPIEDRPG